MKEVELTEVLGVARARLRDLRKKMGDMEGVYWSKEGRDVVWLPDGLYAACSAFGLDDTVVREIVEPALNEEAISAKKTGTALVSRFTKNDRILMAMLDGQEIRVKVNSSRHFIPNMEIPVEHVQEDLWKLVGRCPRARGRW